MIAFVDGKIAEKFIGSVVVDVAGVGYEVQVTSEDYDKANLGDDKKYYTYHHVREQSEELFGFSTLAAKRIFEMLITVQGIGPKAALAILSLGEVEAVRAAIASGDISYISKANGVGKKTAERVTVDLRDKMGAPTYIPGYNPAGNATNFAGDEALDTLMALGFNIADATEALKGVAADKPTAERVKMALSQK
jgi:Holliday junction DNA helicase, RuvA subunit